MTEPVTTTAASLKLLMIAGIAIIKPYLLGIIIALYNTKSPGKDTSGLLKRALAWVRINTMSLTVTIALVVYFTSTAKTHFELSVFSGLLVQSIIAVAGLRFLDAVIENAPGVFSTLFETLKKALKSLEDIPSDFLKKWLGLPPKDKNGGES